VVHADDWPVPRGASHEPVPYRFDPAIVKKIPRAFLEDSSACLLYSGATHLIEADGTTETITHEVTRLNGRKGIEGLGEFRQITYDPTCQKLVLNEARIIKADGRIVPIEARHVHLRDVSTDYQVYDRDKQLVISFPNLEVGDVYEVKWTTRGRNDEFFGKFFMRSSFGDDQYPVVRDEMRVRLPRDMPFKYASVNGKVEPAITDEGSSYRQYYWLVTNRPAPPQDSDRPSREELRLEVACSTFASWEEVGAWKEKLRAECWNCTPEIRDIVKQVTRDLKTPLEKARALTHWVRRRVRYISISSSGRGYTPRLPGLVLASRYGDCKDQAQLLAVMLREAGLDVSLASLGMLDDGQVIPDVPSPWATHAILLVKIDGKDHWIDTTVTHAGWDFLPRSDRDRVVYVTPAVGQAAGLPIEGKAGLLSAPPVRILRTPPLLPEDNRIEQTTRIQVQPDGTAQCRRSVTYQGQSAVRRRDDWIETPPGERRRLVTAELQDANRNCRLLSLAIDERALADLDGPVTANMEFRIPRYFAGDDGSASDSVAWGRLLGYTFDPERKLPLNLGMPFESIHRFVIQLPLTHSWGKPPAAHEVKSPWGWFHVSVKGRAESRRLELTFHTRLEKSLVKPGDLADFQKFHEEVYKQYRVWLTPTPTTDLAVAPALELLETLSPDRARALVLAKLYQDNDKDKEAYRTARRAVMFRPHDRELWELAADLAPTPTQELKIYREMVRRFPKQKRYVIVLGELLAKTGDPAGAKKRLLPLTGDVSAEIRGKAHYQLAHCAAAEEQPAAALKHLEAAAKDVPGTVGTAEALSFKANLHEQLGQLPEAVKAYRRALRDDRQDEEILLNLIRLEQASGQTAEALDYVRRYTLAAGKDAGRLVKAAELHFDLGRYDDALELASRAEKDPHAQRILGLIRFQRREFAPAVSHLKRAEPDAEVIEALIRGHLALGCLADAKRDLEKIASVKPTLKLRQSEVATLRLLLRRASLAKEIAVEPSQATARARALDALVCAEYAQEQGSAAGEVDRLLGAALAEKVELGPAYALRGLLRLEKGRVALALADAEKAVTLSPREPRAFLVRGRARLETGHAGALADLEKAAKLSEHNDPAILHWLAAAQFQMGHRAEALTNQRLAAKFRPRDQEIGRQLQEFERAIK
jgi:tetratricopeptide (TPR) repeat protein